MSGLGLFGGVEVPITEPEADDPGEPAAVVVDAVDAAQERVPADVIAAEPVGLYLAALSAVTGTMMMAFGFDAVWALVEVALPVAYELAEDDALDEVEAAARVVEYATPIFGEEVSMVAVDVLMTCLIGTATSLEIEEARHNLHAHAQYAWNLMMGGK